MGGEKPLLMMTGVLKWGSPPRGRGKAAAYLPIPFVDGITPAWAGKSVFGLLSAGLYEDHPRVGGEKTKKIP